MNSLDVVVTEGVWSEPFEELTRHLDVVRVEEAWRTAADVPEGLRGVRALVVRNRTQVDAALLDALPALQVVGRAGVGLDNIDVSAADARDVAVIVPFGANALSVAEHTLAMVLALLRDLPAHDAAVRAGRWDRSAGRELGAAGWGLLGAGATARETARLASAFGCRVRGYDPYVTSEQATRAGIELVGLDEVLSGSDVISVHLPATPDTVDLLNARAFAVMRPGAVLVNVGRGEVIDEAALADALRGGRLAGAGLDVRATEPPAPGPLDDAPHLLFSPHVAGITVQSQQRIAQILAEDLGRALHGETITHPAGRVTRPARVDASTAAR